MKWRWRARLLSAVAIFVATAYLAIDSSSLASKPKFLGRTTTTEVVLAAVVVGLSASWGVVDALLERRYLTHRDHIARQVSEISFALWYLTSRSMRTDRLRERFGVHVWLVPQWHWTLVPRRIRRLTPRTWRRKLWTPYMWRAAEYRMDRHNHQGTGIQWKRGTGAIGMCWSTRDRFSFDLHANWGPGELTEARWNLLSPELQLNLRYDQAKSLQAKYRRVVAVPIFRKDHGYPDPEFIGCVVIDTPAGEADLNIAAARFRGLAVSAAAAIAEKIDRSGDRS